MLLYGALPLFKTNFHRCRRHALLSFLTSSRANPIKALRLARIEHCSGTVVTRFLPSVGLERRKKGEEYNFGCAVDLARCHVCAKRKEAGRQATEREIEKKKKEKRRGRDEEGKN